MRHQPYGGTCSGARGAGDRPRSAWGLHSPTAEASRALRNQSGCLAMASRVSPWSGTFQTRADPDGAGRDDKGSLDRWGGAHLPLPLSLSCPWGLCGTCLVEHQAGEMLCVLHMATEGWWRLPTVQSWLPVCEWGTCHVHQLRGAETRHCSSPRRSSTETPSGTDHTECHTLQLWPARVHLHCSLRGTEAPQTAWVSLTSIGLGSFLNVGRSWPLGRQMTDLNLWLDRSPWAQLQLLMERHVLTGHLQAQGCFRGYLFWS